MAPEANLSKESPPRVLVIEDEEVIQMLLTDFLTDQGYEVVTVPNGALGLKEFEAGEFSVALVDYGLPGLHGIDVCRKMHAMRPQVPLMLMTGLGGKELAERETCINQVVSKPFDLFDVLKAIQALPTP